MRSHRRQTLSSFLLGEEKSDSASLTSLLLLAIMFMRSLDPGGVVLLLNGRMHQIIAIFIDPYLGN